MAAAAHASDTERRHQVSDSTLSKIGLPAEDVNNLAQAVEVNHSVTTVSNFLARFSTGSSLGSKSFISLSLVSVFPPILLVVAT
jgi:hypothetical protein